MRHKLLINPKKNISLLILILTLLLNTYVFSEEFPFDYTVRFSDTMKIDNRKVEQNIIDTFEFEGTVYWTEYTKLYARVKLDNWSDSAGGILFGSELDQRYGMHHDEFFDKSYVKSQILKEFGLTDAPDLEILGGYNAGGVLHEEWTAFDFENYRLAGIRGVVVQSDASLWRNLYLTTAFNPALGSNNTVWNGINGALSDRPDILAAVSWRSESWWGELYWDNYSNSDASLRGSELSIFGISSFLDFNPSSRFNLKIMERLEYGLNKNSSGDNHMRYSGAVGVNAEALHGLSSNISFNGFFLDRKELNLGWDSELMLTKTLGAIVALGGIRLAKDPDFVYEAGISGHFNFLSLYCGYSDHKGGNDGWFSGAFDTTRTSGRGIFLRLDIEY